MSSSDLPSRPSADHPLADAYLHDTAKRKNIAPAGLAGQGKTREVPKWQYAYDPHLPPTLRSDPSGKADGIPELLAKARQSPLSDEDVKLLAEALRDREPWLEWAGKREAKSLEVDPIAIHIHERVATQAILRVAARQDVTRSLFADPEQDYREAVQFYQHDVDWSNRLILGDSLQVMASLARREDLAGKVQCIYIDPPYGIKYGSNFQSEVGKRDVKDRPEDLTRELEMVKAYRDTWNLGVHSYLAYLRDRLLAAKELLTDSGSVFVQISDENLHRVRVVMDEVFGPQNYAAIINCTKTSGQTAKYLSITTDYLIWYAKNIELLKYRPVFREKALGGDGAGMYQYIANDDGSSRRITPNDLLESSHLIGKPFRLGDITSQRQGRPSGEGTAMHFPVEVNGGIYLPPSSRGWSTTNQGMKRLAGSDRLAGQGERLSYVRYLEDFSASIIDNNWGDTAGVSDRVYIVQTNTKMIERCLLMTTDPGDLVIDPTCGSGTTAYVAEQWGRRWITIDSSRVALAIARQRLLTAQFDYYKLRDPGEGVDGGFIYKTVPHITLKSIAQNVALDAIFEKWEPILADKLAYLNLALGEVMPDVRQKLLTKLELKKRKRDRANPVTDADTRRWQLPTAEAGWKEWEVPFDTDPDWPLALQEALTEYRAAWRGKRDEVNAAIAARADQEELVDKPEIERGKVRVSGPFTVEGVMPAEDWQSLQGPSPIAGEPDEELPTFADAEETPTDASANAEAYLDKMLRLLKNDGVRFPDNKVVKFDSLETILAGPLHAKGEWTIADETRYVAVVVGPQYGPVTTTLVEDCLPPASRGGYHDIVFAGFSFDGAAQALIQDDPNPRVRCHLAHIRPDVTMSDLLKESPNTSNQIFTVSGLPRASAEQLPDGEWIATMEGVDIYDPVGNTVRSTGAEKVAAWFLDSDYDGKAFCITQAFFPDPKAWEKLARALGGTVDADRFVAFSGTRSLPFPAGKYKRAAVKVIDPRGNEVVKILHLGEMTYHA